MKSILNQLYEGILSPSGDTPPKDPNYSPTWSMIEQEVKYLAERLSAEDVKHLQRLDELLSDAAVMDGYAGFSRGFRLGMGLLWEVIQEDT